MKKMIKILSVALIAVATFVSAGCSCSLSDAKIIEKVRALETSVVYKKGDSLQDFKLTATKFEIHNGGTTTKYVFDTDLNGAGTYVYTEYVDDEETAKETRLSIADDTLLNSIYDSIKDQPLNAYGEMTNGKYRNLIGLYGASDQFLASGNVKVEAEKKLFKKDVTFVVEYKVNLLERYRQTIVINEDNKITSAKIEMVGTYVTDQYGTTQERVYPIFVLEIQYK